jgi:hypothetical protein
MFDMYDSATPLAPITTSTTKALIDTGSATRSGVRSVFCQLDAGADKYHYIGDSNLVAAGTAGVICQLAAGQGVTLPVKSTGGLYVVAGTSGSASKLYVAVLS